MAVAAWRLVAGGDLLQGELTRARPAGGVRDGGSAAAAAASAVSGSSSSSKSDVSSGASSATSGGKSGGGGGGGVFSYRDAFVETMADATLCSSSWRADRYAQWWADVCTDGAAADSDEY